MLDEELERLKSLKEELEENSKLMDVGAPKSFSVEALKCPSCASRINRGLSDAKTLTCGICGSIISLDGSDLKIGKKVFID